MSTNIVLLIIAGMLVCASMYVYFGYLKIANNLYIRLVEDTAEPGTKKSPYVIKREYSSYVGKDFYYIFEGTQRISTKQFSTLKDAQTSMNELEKIGGYQQTKVI